MSSLAEPRSKRSIHYLAEGASVTELDTAVLEALAGLDGALVTDPAAGCWRSGPSSATTPIPCSAPTPPRPPPSSKAPAPPPRWPPAASARS